MRRKDKVTDNDILSSLNLKRNKDQIFKTNKKVKMGSSSNNGGASGSFFFYSDDNRYIIKTIKYSEVRVYISRISRIKQHLIDQVGKGRPSLLAKIYGIFNFKMSG